MARLEAKRVRYAAEGRWLDVLERLAPELAPAIDRLGRHVPCPVHGGRDGFRLFRDAPWTGGGICNTCGVRHDGFALLQWLLGWSFPETLRQVAREVGLEDEEEPHGERTRRKGRMPPRRPRRAEDARKRERVRAQLGQAWKQSVSLDRPEAAPVASYLVARGLDLRWPIEDLRAHPALAYWEPDERRGARPAGEWPALLAMVRDGGGRPVTLHRTYVSGDGDEKAPVPEPRKLMPYDTDHGLPGGAIRLAGADVVMGVAEGVETALAAMQATGMPVWAAVSSSMMPSLEVPDGVEMVCVWADLDRRGVGQDAARALERRLRERKVHVWTLVPSGDDVPGEDNVDWLDMLQHRGPDAFRVPAPAHKRMRRELNAYRRRRARVA